MKSPSEFILDDPITHIAIFGKERSATVAILAKADAAKENRHMSLERSDYNDVLAILLTLYMRDYAELNRFVERIKKLRDLKRLNFRTRCRFIYQLLINYFPPEAQELILLKLEKETVPLVSKSEYDKYARIGISYQATLDAVIALTKAKDKQQLWVDMLSEALEGLKQNT